MESLLHVGKVKDAHNLKGEIFVLVFSKEAEWLDDLEEFHLEKDGRKIALKCERVRAHKEGIIVKPASFENRNQAEEWIGAQFFIPEELLVSKPGEVIFLREILNFKVVDPSGKELGVIKNFSSNGAQDLLLVQTPDGDFDVPFVDAFIQKIEFEKKQIIMDLPEGLLENE